MEDRVQLERFIDREPKQFAYFHRLMGYSILSLILVIYAFTSPNTNYQIYIPPFFLFLLFVSSKLEHWLQYQFDKKTQKSVFFAIDAIVVAVTLAGVHLNSFQHLLRFLHCFTQQLIVVFPLQLFV